VIKSREEFANKAATREMVQKYPNPIRGLNEVVVRHFLKQLSSALEFMRSKNYIHRDIKPQNLLIEPSAVFLARHPPDVTPYSLSSSSGIPPSGIPSLPILKIADFGFARSLPSTSLAETLCGSPLYMAPEILRYEKYDAKADLWSVGTVLYELMTGKPPFRAANHVELLRKIERGEDKIKFAEDTVISSGMKLLIRGLLKRGPTERMSFQEFFSHKVILEEIPHLHPEDRPLKEIDQQIPVASKARTTGGSDQPTAYREIPGRRKPEYEGAYGKQPVSTRPQSSRDASDQPNQFPFASPPREARERRAPITSRPTITSHATAPSNIQPDTVRMERQQSRTAARGMISKEQEDRLRKDMKSREDQEKAEQDVLFEREYVVVEKRAVEVNALADELAASPRVRGDPQRRPSSPSTTHQGAMIRRATTSGSSVPTSNAPSSAVSIANRARSGEHGHQRGASYERRYGASPSSATSAISKALNMANFRLFGIGFSPPLKGGQSPPTTYGAFPSYPTTGSLLMIGDSKLTGPASDEDIRTIQIIEETATRSDVVYGFAEVKYKQLIPVAPSMAHGLGLLSGRGDQEQPAQEDDDLTVDAIVTLSEEALVLYVKSLSLLAKSMDIAAAWWQRKNKAEAQGVSPRSDGSASATTQARINNVVQWIRNRFNEVLEKAEFVRLKLIKAQSQLPSDHPSHPNNLPGDSGSLGSSGDRIVVSTGVSAEKLMYDRALEMSRAAAVNELVGEDLPGCEIAYVTAIRMLEAVLETEDEPSAKPKEGNKNPINGMEAEDREVVGKRESSLQ
jgi:serine/threonine-protein kinase ULK2